MAAEEYLPITDAGELVDKDRKTIDRALRRDEFPNAIRDERDGRRPWLIPVSDLIAAGYEPISESESGTTDGRPDNGTTREDDSDPPDAKPLREEIERLEAQVSELTAQLADARARAEERERWLKHFFPVAIPGIRPAGESTEPSSGRHGDGSLPTWFDEREAS